MENFNRDTGTGDPIDLSAADSVTFRMFPRITTAGAAPTIEAAGVIDPDQNVNRGKVSYVWATGDTDVPGFYNAQAVITWSGGGIQTFPNGYFWPVEVLGRVPGLLELDDLKDSLGDNSTNNDNRYMFAISAATAAIRSITRRSFEAQAASPAASDRTYTYDGSGVLETDDFTTLNSVSAVGQVVPPNDALMLGPQTPGESAYGVYSWLELYPQVLPESPEMGFTRNLDRWPWLNWQFPLLVTVNADYGWPSIPADVQQAALLLASEWVRVGPGGSELSSESIASYSVSWFQQAASQGAIDNAQGLLDPYIRSVLV